LLELKDDGIRKVAFSADGQWLVTDGWQTAKVWDARTGAILRELKGHTDVVASATFSPDGTRVVTGGADKTVKIWDMRTGAPLLDLKGDAFVTRVAFSPDGTRLAAIIGGTVKIWDAGELGMSTAESPAPEEREYRLIWTRPRPEFHRQEYAKALKANEPFAVRFHLDRLLAYAPPERAALLAERGRLQKDDLLLQARTAVHSPKLGKVAMEPIALLALRLHPQALRLYGGLSLRAGKPAAAIAPLTLALGLRPRDRPPVEELLLALAYIDLDANHRAEADKWHARAIAWLDRYRLPLQLTSALARTPGAPLCGLVGLWATPADPRYSAADWETWYECEVFRAEVEARLGASRSHKSRFAWPLGGSGLALPPPREICDATHNRTKGCVVSTRQKPRF
jgi:hypothetical protein